MRSHKPSSSPISRWLACLILIAPMTAAVAQQATGNSTAAPAAATPTAPTIFAIVEGTGLTVSDFDRTAKETYRDKFYHGKPPEAEVNQMLLEVGMKMIDNVLLEKEITRRQVKEDPAMVDAEIARYEKQYGLSPAWQQQREETLPKLRAFLSEKSKASVLEREIKAAAAPNAEKIRQFYESNKNLFTEPVQNKLSIILMKVDPSSSNEVWDARAKEAKEVRTKLDQGVEFATLAEIHSQDASGASGGDIGYLHQKMLSDAVEEEVAKLSPGQIGGPMRILEGFLIVRLDARKEPRVRDFAEVAERAKELANREAGETAWKAFHEQLRAGARIQYSPDFQKLIDDVKTAAAAKASAAAAKPTSTKN